jgi:light-regulated signal transduction histidine kinase (bacteriophytochrome)
MPIAERLVQSGMKSFMYNAMILQDEMMGFLWFMSDQKDFFTQEYREIADEFANQLGIVLSHLQLIEAIKGHTEDLESKVEERTEQLLIANKELEAFSYTVAHDLRTPLRTIDGYCNIMLEDYTATLPNKAKEVLQIIIKTTHKMDILIKELLQLARLNRDALHYSSLDMTHMVQNVLNNIRETQLIEGFSIDISPLEPCQGDYALMSEVWQNLLENAIKFTLPCPVKSIQIGSRKEPNETVYFVKDTGVGFDMQYVDKIFAVFQRLHRERDFEGTGIGLAIVKKVIERHNGQVWAESFVGKGTTVYFSIPH